MTNMNMRNPDKAGADFETVAGFVGVDHPAFFLQFWPAGVPRAHVVYLPPFAEEMNRCRALVAEQARRFARDGLSCTLLDFYGTGESPGDLTDASLSIWRQNIDAVLEQLLLRNQCPVYLWGCRLGALLALDYLSWKPRACAKLLLWQPVVSGSAFVTQMLRQRTAALMQKGEKPESTAAMKMQLAAGKAFEVAGYKLGGTLLSAIDRAEIAALLQGDLLDNLPEIFWFEHTTDDTALPGARANRAIGQLQGAGAQVRVNTFTGDPVWQLHKRGVCDDLLLKTGRLGL
jgi:exosortase A-associated hydrolase 2